MPTEDNDLEPAAYLSEREYPDPMANDRRSHISKEGAKINPGKRDFDEDEIQPLFAAEDLIQLIADRIEEQKLNNVNGSHEEVIEELEGLKSEICSQEVVD